MDVLSLIDRAGAAAGTADSAESAVRAIMALCHGALGDRQAHLMEGALAQGQHQFFVGGGFFITPDGMHQMLVGNTGFPPEQERLLIPIDGGHPGWVVANRAPLLLEDTTTDNAFRQYLKTSRMGSAVYAPLEWDGEILGLIIVAAQARNTMRPVDLAVLTAMSRLAAAAFVAKGGREWLAAMYPPDNLWRAAAG